MAAAAVQAVPLILTSARKNPASNTRCQSDSSTVKIVCQVSEILPFLIGQVMGIWERSQGRKPRVSLIFIDSEVEILIESLLEYA